MRISVSWDACTGASWTGMKPGLLQSAAMGVLTFANWLWLRLADSTTQRLSMLALRPLANAMAAVETPGPRQAATTWRLKSSL